MSYRDADLYGDVADVLEALHDTVDSYVLFLQKGEDREREYAAAVAGTASPSAGPPSPSLSTSTAREQALTRQYIRDSVPRLMELCTSVQARLRAAARTMPNNSASRRSAGPSTPAPLSSSSSSSSRAEAGRVLVTRKLGDVMENAHMMRGLVKLQRQRQLLPRASIGGTPTMMDGEDEDDGPLRMKQLIRVTQYNLEDTERLLRLAYPEGGPIDVVAQGDDGNSDDADANSPPLSRSPTAGRGLTRSPGVRNGRYGGSVEPASNSPGSASSPSETPRSSAHTAPYVRRSVSQEPFNVPTSYVFPPPSSTQDANGSRHGANDNSNSNVVELGDEDGARLPPGSPTGILTPRSILARSRHGDGSASTASRNTSRTSWPRVHFAMDEPAKSPSHDNHSQRSAGAAAAASAGPAASLHQVADRPAALAVAVPRGTNAAATADADPSLSDAALAATATPARPQPRRGSGLLSNPVVRCSSTESDDAMSTSGGPLLFTSSPFRSSDDRVGVEHGHEHDDSASGVMRLAPFGLRSDSQTSLPFASGSSGSASSAAQTSSSTTATGTNGRGSGGDGADTDESNAGAAAAAAAAVAASTSSLPSAPMHPAPAFATSNGYGGGVTRRLSWSATPSVLSMATVSIADAPRGILRTAPSRGSSAASATSSHGYTAHRDSGGGQSGASGPLPWQSTHAHVASHCSTSASGSSGSARPPPTGLPPRSPRRHEEQRLSLSCASASMGQHASLPLPRADPDARVVTRHMQRLPGELWATILASHRAEMEDVVREDVVDLFNYGEAVPVLRNEDVCDVHFTVVDTHLYIRVKLEHAQALTEAEINLRLGLCSFPLMTALYEEFFTEYQAKEFEPIEDSSTTLNSSTMRFSDARSSVRGGRNSISDDHYHNGGDSEGDSKSDGLLRKESTFAPGPTTPRSGDVDAFTTAGAATAAAPSADPNSADAPSPTSPLSIETSSRTASVAGDSTAASYIFSVASPRSVHVEGGGGGGHHRSGSEAESSAATPSSVEPTAAAAAQAVLQRGRSVSYVSVIADAPVAPSSSTASTQQQQRHSHTVRLPGVHWSRLAASNVPAMADLGAAFVADAGAALGVLPSESRAACQDVCLSYGGGLVVDLAWDNGELYPGAHWLTAPEVAAALSRCLFPSVRAVYAAACGARRFDNDLAAAAAAAAEGRGGTGGKARSRDVVQLILPAKSELDHKSSLRGSSSNTNTPERVALKQQQQHILMSPSTGPTTKPNFAGAQQQHASPLLVAATAPTTTRVAPSSKSASASLRLVPTSSAAGLRPRLAQAPAVAAEEESGSSTASQSASLHGQQQPPPPPASAFDRANSAASLASVEAEPRMAVPQPTITAASYTARKSSDARAAGGASRPQRPPPSRPRAAAAAPAAAAPASAATAAAAAAAAPAPAPEPQTLNQLSVVHGISLAVLRQWNPALAELDAGAVIPASATVYVPRVTSTSPALKIRIDAPPAAAAATTAAATAQRRVQPPRQARADARPPAPALPPQPAQQQQHQQQKPSTATTHAPPSHVDPAAAASTNASAAPLPPPATNNVKQHRAQPPAAQQQPQAAEPTAAPLAAEALVKNTREATPRMPPPAKATSSQPQSAAPPLTAAPAPSRKVYQLPTTMSARPDEPRGIDVLLASQGALRLLQEGGAAAATAGGVPVDTDERTASSSKASEEVTAAAVERELGMRLDGLLVSTVRRGSVAARACVQAGDTLRTLDGQPLIAQSDFLRGMARQQHLQRQRLKNSGGSGEFTVLVTATTPRGIPTTYRLRVPPMQRDEVQPTSTQPAAAAAAAAAATMPTGPSPQRMAARLGVPPPPPPPTQHQQQPRGRFASVTAQARGLERPLSIGPAARQHPPAATVAAAAARTGTPTSARLRVSSTGASARPMHVPSSRPKLRDPQQQQQQQQQHVEVPDTLHAVTSGEVQPVSARRLTRDGVGSAARMRGPHT